MRRGHVIATVDWARTVGDQSKQRTHVVGEEAQVAEHLYWIAGKEAVPAERVGLAEVGLREVADLQEWVIQHPEVLGLDVLIVTSEYNSWASAQGLTAKERLDVLGLDPSGQLVVAELKRESDPTVHIQAITYAALVSGFDAELLVEVFAEFRRKRGHDLTLEQARAELHSHVGGDLDGEILSNPRLVLVAHAFPAQVLTSAEWLSARGIDIALVQVQAWRIGGGIAATFDQVYPIPGVGDALLAPARRKVAEANEKVAQRARSATAVSIIIEQGLVADGHVFRFIPGRDVAADVRAHLADWIDAHPDSCRATWSSETSPKVLRWEQDGDCYTATGLASKLLLEATGVQVPLQGTVWWVDDDGADLATIAGIGGARRDWTDLHDLIAEIEPGEWTNYGSLGEAIALPAQPVGTHIATCSRCPHGAHRVLTANGRPAESFRWASDSTEQRTCAQVLEEEGLTFDEAGRASKDRFVSGPELAGRRVAATGATPERETGPT